MEINRRKTDAFPGAGVQARYSVHPLIITLISAAIVLVAAFYVYGWEHEEHLEEFSFTTDTYQRLLEGRLSEINIELDSAKRLFQGMKFVNRSEFSSFVLGATIRPRKVEAVFWIPRVTNDKRRLLENRDWMWGLNGRSVYDSNLSNPDQRNTSGSSRTTHYPVLFAEPADKMGNLIGLDLASTPSVRSLLEQARDEGTVVPMTGMPLLLGETDNGKNLKPVVNLVQPIYRTAEPLQTIKRRREEHLGFFILQYNIGLVLEAVLSISEPRGLDIYIVDVEADDGEEIVYYRPSRLGKYRAPLTFPKLWRKSEFIHKSPLHVSGRQWKTVMLPSPTYSGNIRYFESFSVLIFGLLLTALLSYTMFTIQRRTDVIQKTVKSRTQDLELRTQQLEESEQRLSLALMASNAGYWVRDIQNDKVFWSDQNARLLGYDPREVEASFEGWVNRIHPDERSSISRVFQKNIADRSEINFEYRILLPDGAVRWIHNIGSPLIDFNGETTAITGIQFDITERKLIEEKLETANKALQQEAEKRQVQLRELNFQKRALDEHAIVSIADTKGDIIYANDKFCQTSGYSRDELEGQNHRILRSDEHPPEFFGDLWRTISSGKVWNGEIKNKRKDGSSYWLKVTIVPFLDEQGKPFQYVAIRTDITDRKNSERDLRASQRMISDMLENTQEGFWQLDNDVRVVKINAAMCDILGRSEDEVLGRSVYDFADEKNTEIFRYQRKRRNAGKKDRYEISLQRPDGTNVPCINNGTPIYDGQGEMVGFVGMWTDITELKKIEESLYKSETRFRQFTEVSSDWVWETDEDLRFTYYSRSQGGSTQKTSHIIGKTRQEIMPASEIAKPHWQKHLSDLEMRRDFKDFDFEYMSPGQGQAHIRISGSPYFDENNCFLGYRGTGKDITEQVLAAHALVEARQEADKANRAKSEFLSTMSHELRTPLNSIIGFGQLLEDDPDEVLSETQERCVEHIIKGGRHLLGLISEVLDLAKIESRTVDLDAEPLLPGDVFRECLDLLQGMANERNITLIRKNTSDDLIVADHFRFKQVLINLLSNAIKYNRAGGSVTYGCENKAGGQVHIFVADTGEGISEDDMVELFNPFERFHAEKSDIEGTGIGLTISKRLVEAMGGVIGCDSTVGEGSTFWIDFPQAESVPQQVSVPRAPAEELQARHKENSRFTGTMLYIEDDKNNTALMELIVTRIEGVSMISAATAELGLELAASEKPDMILLDINLPEMSGYEAIARLKENEKTRDIPVVALSAAAMPHDIVRGKDAGFLHYLTKPIEINEVTDVIRDVIENG